MPSPGLPCNAGSPRLGSIYMGGGAAGQAARGRYRSVRHPRESAHGTSTGGPRRGGEATACSRVIPRAPWRNRARWRFPPLIPPERGLAGGAGGPRAGPAGGCRRGLRRVRPEVRKRKRSETKYVSDLGFWSREEDLNLRPPGYEPGELPDCSIPQRWRLPLLSGILQTGKAARLNITHVSCRGQALSLPPQNTRKSRSEFS